MSYCQGCADREAEIATLEAALDQERARGAVRCQRLREAREALDTLPANALGSGRTSDGQEYPIRDEMIHYITQAIGDPDDAVATLLELAEAAGGVVRNGGYLAPEPEALRELEAKWSRWWELTR